MGEKKKLVDVARSGCIVLDMNNAIALPTVHLNGTSRQSLIDDNDAAYNALRAAVRALEKAAPNARDYYVQGDGAFANAVAQHVARLTALRSVLADLEAIAESLSH